MPGLIYLTFCSVVVVVNRHSVMKKHKKTIFLQGSSKLTHQGEGCKAAARKSDGLGSQSC